MKTIILISILLFQAQFQTYNLIGKWSFSKYESNKKMDDETKIAINNAFSKFAFEFRNDATYDFQKRRKLETGTWKADGEVITTINSDGFIDKIKIIQKHNDTIKLEIENGEFVVFSRNK